MNPWKIFVGFQIAMLLIFWILSTLPNFLHFFGLGPKPDHILWIQGTCYLLLADLYYRYFFNKIEKEG
jgi:hypothetical protein